MASTAPDDIFESGTDIVEALDGAVRSQVRSDFVAVIEFDRPPHNYFDVELIGAIVTFCETAAERGARAAVLCSAGRAFCAGADFAAAPDGALDPAPLYKQAARLFRQPLPLVAAVQGAAIGGGTGLALAADFRVAAPEARFAVNFAHIGIHHGFGLSVTLPRVVGRQVAMDLLYTGRRTDGVTAYEIGLADRLSTAVSLRIDSLSWAQEIAASAPLAVASIRRTLRDGLAEEVFQAVAHECAEQQILFATEDFAEGVRAVAERRTGNFLAR
ncbi:enoyl-CoA hydratase/isomerase family protein [Rhodococcus koreensis]